VEAIANGCEEAELHVIVHRLPVRVEGDAHREPKRSRHRPDQRDVRRGDLASFQAGNALPACPTGCGKVPLADPARHPLGAKLVEARAQHGASRASTAIGR
jgi:hypothetical protein